MSLRGMDTGASGMAATTTAITVTGNNISNNTTNGFKKSTVAFADILYRIAVIPGTPATNQIQPLGESFGVGVLVSAIQTDFTMGPLTQGLPMDVAINGAGFFRVVDSKGQIFYTRLGAFQPKTEGATGPLNLQIRGDAVIVQPPIVLPGAPGPLSVSRDGVVRQGDVVAGQFQLVQFRNPDGLLQVGDLLFQQTAASGPEIVGTPGSSNFGETIDGFLEGSNVSIAQELVNLLNFGQAFNQSAQAFQVGNAEVIRTIELARATT